MPYELSAYIAHFSLFFQVFRNLHDLNRNGVKLKDILNQIEKKLMTILKIKDKLMIKMKTGKKSDRNWKQKDKLLENNYTCAASRNTTDRIMVIRAKHTTIV